jgi:NADPH-dependent 2,4-dienoyl-CoA reductase/sulfur reductase-like enzyme
MIHHFDILIIGGGPAGMAAAIAAAEAGKRVGVVDDNPAYGGQIWRGEQDAPSTSESREWFAKLGRTDVSLVAGTRIVAAPKPGTLTGETIDGARTLIYDKLIIATGARERFLPFPGWTLPNVCGAGGLQALVKGGSPITGKRVVVAGSGPLLMAVAATLTKRGAKVSVYAEQAPGAKLRRFGLTLFKHGKIGQAISYRWQTRSTRLLTDCWPVKANGDDRVQSVTLTRFGKTWDEPCDYLACGFGLIPQLEIAQLLGCATNHDVVTVDDMQQTSVDGVYCAGESTGIGGLELALLEGRIAGAAAAGDDEKARWDFRDRDKARRFAAVLDECFALRDELRYLADEATIVCRCEDVPYSKLKDYDSWRGAKLQTRCGMGPCQGRVCGGAADFLFGWENESVRPPIFPTRLENLSTEQHDDPDEILLA